MYGLRVLHSGLPFHWHHRAYCEEHWNPVMLCSQICPVQCICCNKYICTWHRRMYHHYIGNCIRSWLVYPLKGVLCTLYLVFSVSWFHCFCVRVMNRWSSTTNRFGYNLCLYTHVATNIHISDDWPTLLSLDHVCSHATPSLVETMTYGHVL